MVQTSCQFSVPVDLNPNTGIEDYEFSVLDCTSTDQAQTLIQNPQTGSEFYLDKTLNYGEILVLFFIFLFIVFGSVKVIMDFWIPHRVIRKS